MPERFILPYIVDHSLLTSRKHLGDRRGFQRRLPPKHSKFKPKDHKPRYVDPKHKTPKQFFSSCHKCGRHGHFACDCRTSTYIVEMYREVQKTT